MAFLVRFDHISLSFADQVILSEADLVIEPGERVCLIGRNGAGKSTTLKLISGELQPDDGKIEKPNSLRISSLDQQLAEESDQTVREFVALGMVDQLARIEEYRRLTASPDASRANLAEIENLERQIEAAGGWAVDTQIDALISQLSLPRQTRMSELSGGWRRRVALAQALVAVPDLLLLDEPTNHLDISTIEWLERQVTRFSGAVLFVTHDRSFVQRVASRIVDLDRGKLRSWPGGYREYLRSKAKAEEEEDRQNALFDKKLAEEEAWIRQGIKAREHRNEGRVRALEALRDEREARINRPRTARIHMNESAALSGRKVIEAKHVTHSFGGKPLLKDFSLRVMRGDRIGIVGNNGVGKTTLLRILLGELEPESGTVKLGTNLEVAYFDQLRRELDASKTVAEIVGEGRDYISIYGKKKHVVGYLTDFLFSAKRAMTPVAALSGGERNRVILAKLFTRSANLLVLDEPTNDLDVETLEALEARLAEYSGTLLVVSHDRHFLDAVVTSMLVFEDDGVVRQYAGGYSDWVRHRHALATADEPRKDKPQSTSVEAASRQRPSSSGKLSYKLQRELDALPDRIEELEAAVADLQAEIGEPQFYRRPREDVDQRLNLLTETQKELDAAVERWAELEEQAESLAAGNPVQRRSEVDGA
jgi:ATP-binding cassette subfamily F protein uup